MPHYQVTILSAEGRFEAFNVPAVNATAAVAQTLDALRLQYQPPGKAIVTDFFAHGFGSISVRILDQATNADGQIVPTSLVPSAHAEGVCDQCQKPAALRLVDGGPLLCDPCLRDRNLTKAAKNLKPTVQINRIETPAVTH